MMRIRTSLQRQFTTRRDPDAVKAAGWHEVGVLAVSVDDDRLSDFERQFLENLGAKLYGARGREPSERGNSSSDPRDSSPIKQREDDDERKSDNS